MGEIAPTSVIAGTAGHPRSRVVVVAHDAARLGPLAPLIRHLHVTGWLVTVTAWSTGPPWGMPPDTEVITTPDPERAWLPAGPLEVVVVDDEARAVVAPERRGLARLVPSRRRQQVPDPGSADRTVSGPERLAELVISDLAARDALKASDVLALTAALDASGGRSITVTTLLDLARPLLAGAHWAALARVATTPWAPPGSRQGRAALAVLAAIARLNLGEGVTALPDLVTEGFAAADEDRGTDQRRSFELTAVTLRLLFHRELHAAAEQSLLVSDPAQVTTLLARSALLGDLRHAGSGRGQQPGEPTRAQTESPRTESLRTARPRAVVLPGAYPSFARDVEAVLAQTHEVLMHDLGAANARFRNTEAESVTLQEVHGLTGSGASPTSSGHGEPRPWAGASLVFADWADKGAAIASWTLDPSTRFVVRCHGADSLSSWVHVIDWSRVDTLICVSDHLCRTMVGLLGDRLSGTEVVIVPPALAVGSLPSGKEAGARFTLGMVGWGQRVKDPLFALDVLGALRAGDPRWSLTLIGPDFPQTGSVPDADYQRATRDRVLAADVRGGLCFTGRLTRDEVRQVLPTIGFGLSTSRRESFHLGAAELMGSGSIPVIRDWPMYAGMSGAASVFPADAVVSTVGEAVARIAALAAEDRWEDRGTQARAWIARRYSPGDVSDRLRSALLGA